MQISRSVPLFVLGTIALLVPACSSKEDRSSFTPEDSTTTDPTTPGAFGPAGDGAEGGAGPVDVGNTPPCDDGVSSDAAESYAKAIGLCTTAAKEGYGLVSATFTRGYDRTDAPKAEQRGILSKFGKVIVPREGSALTVLSTGYAQEFNGPGNAPFGGISLDSGGLLGAEPLGVDWWRATRAGTGTAPPGFPKPAAACPLAKNVNDTINLKLEIKAPPTATGFKFDFNFFSGEWPAYVCSEFNDGFVAYLTAKGFNGGKADNVSFDKNNNPVSVNNGFFDRCTPDTSTGCANPFGVVLKSECPGGPDELAGTGFGILGNWCPLLNERSTNGGATGWLTSQAPVEGGETFTLEFMIWDTGDGVLDSSVLIDNFKWVGGGEVKPSTDRPR